MARTRRELGVKRREELDMSRADRVITQLIGDVDVSPPNEDLKYEEILSYEIKPKDPTKTMAGIKINSDEMVDIWKPTTDAKEISESDDVMFCKSKKDLVVQLKDRYAGEVLAERYDNIITAWRYEIQVIENDKALQMCLPRNQRHPDSAQIDEVNSMQLREEVMEIKAKAIEDGFVVIQRHTLLNLHDAKLITTLGKFDPYASKFGLIEGGFVVEWSIDSRHCSHAKLHYDESRFNNLVKRRKTAEVRKKKKDAEDKKKGIGKFTEQERTRIAGFRSWLLYCLGKEVKIFSRFKYIGNQGRGTPTACSDIKELIAISRKMDVDFRAKYKRPRDRNKRREEGDYTQCQYSEFIKHMRSFTKTMRVLKHKKTISQESIDAIAWVSRFIERENRKKK